MLRLNDADLHTIILGFAKSILENEANEPKSIVPIAKQIILNARYCKEKYTAKRIARIHVKLKTYLDEYVPDEPITSLMLLTTLSHLFNWGKSKDLKYISGVKSKVEDMINYCETEPKIVEQIKIYRDCLASVTVDCMKEKEAVKTKKSLLRPMAIKIRHKTEKLYSALLWSLKDSILETTKSNASLHKEMKTLYADMSSIEDVFKSYTESEDIEDLMKTVNEIITYVDDAELLRDEDMSLILALVLIELMSDVNVKSLSVIKRYGPIFKEMTLKLPPKMEKMKESFKVQITNLYIGIDNEQKNT